MKKILHRFNIQNTKSVRTPFHVYLKLSSKQCSRTEKERIAMSQVPYSLVVGSLMFAMVSTRTDTTQAVRAISKYMANLGCDHWTSIKWIIRYLSGTSYFGLCHNYTNLSCGGYLDSDFAGQLDKRRSIPGYVFSMAGGAICWESKLQSIVALSHYKKKKEEEKNGFSRRPGKNPVR